MKRVGMAAFSISVLLFTASAQGDELKRYAWSWPLTLNGDSAAWQVELPIDVYQSAADPQLRDLVVIDSQGNAAPTAWRATDSATVVSARTELPAFTLPENASTSGTTDGPLNLRIERDTDGRVRSIGANLGEANKKGASAPEDYLVDASKLDAPIDSLRLDWDATAEPVNAQFAISASDDLQSWRGVLASANVLSLAHDGNRLDRHEVRLAGTHAKYLRLRRIDPGTALSNLRVSAITSAQRSPTRAAREWLAVGSKESTTDAKPTSGAEYRYSLPAALPVEAIRLDLGSDNSVARVSVASRRSDNEAWIPRVDFIAFRLQQGGEAIVNDEITLSSSARDTQWRVQSATPLNRAPTLSVAWRHDRLVFLGEGQQHYRLVAGSATARRADYPVDVALSQLRGKLGADWQPPLAVVGNRESLAGEAALQPPSPASKYDWKTFLLWGVLIAAAAGIGYLALSLLKGQKSSS
jgi:hypothetical protein